MLTKKEKIIIGVIILLVIIIGIVLFFVFSSKKGSTTDNTKSTNNNTTKAASTNNKGKSSSTTINSSGSVISKPSTLQNATQVFQLVKNYNKGNPVTGFGGNIQPYPSQGFYLENQSKQTMTSVTLTLTNGYNNIGIWIYTIAAAGNQTPQSAWQTYYQTTATANKSSYTGTITVPCSIPPGGAFIVNMTQTNSGSATFVSATFE
jgi:hypothetical protein